MNKILKSFLIISVLANLVFANTGFAQQAPAAIMFEILGNCGYKIGMAVKDHEKPEVIKKSGWSETIVNEALFQFNLMVVDQIDRCFLRDVQLYKEVGKVYLAYQSVPEIGSLIKKCSVKSKDPAFVDMKLWLQCVVKETSELKLPEADSKIEAETK